MVLICQSLAQDLIDTWPDQLIDISRFMHCLNEPIARQANQEDDCSGSFGNKSQALLDEQALAACMAYVDLNPIRAQIAKITEESEYTPVQPGFD